MMVFPSGLKATDKGEIIYWHSSPLKKKLYLLPIYIIISSAMKPKLYIETSLISYLTARPSRDLIVAAQQQVTHEWWKSRRSKFEMYISQLVIQEAKDGDEEAAAKRLKALENIPLLDLRVEALDLAEKFVRSKTLPQKAFDDALHISVAAIYGLDYLLTWNCKHIANAEIQKEISRVSFEEGYELPIICTPYELMGG